MQFSTMPRALAGSRILLAESEQLPDVRAGFEVRRLTFVPSPCLHIVLS